MRAFFSILLATALLSGCGTDEITPPATGPSQDEVNRVCAGVHCTADYCTSEGGVAACRPASMLYAEGWIDTSYDEDWFAFDLEARAYEVRGPPLGNGSPVCALLEADGVTPVPTQAVSGDVRPNAPGRYFLRVGHSVIPATPGTPYRWELHPR
ncbi:hypothetical protein [Corallococcus exercitus]|uniref:Lipoprotein n=1 Tax=Corallococcus exercitus TaxID=2316736 RepID=A0A7Y4JXI7_9BACT|nr:hypothetical protein [Corallococcus exercitus]NOK13003.1 hypothetical protein [Corallococcus exercitus]